MRSVHQTQATGRFMITSRNRCSSRFYSSRGLWVSPTTTGTFRFIDSNNLISILIDFFFCIKNATWPRMIDLVCCPDLSPWRISFKKNVASLSSPWRKSSVNKDTHCLQCVLCFRECVGVFTRVCVSRVCARFNKSFSSFNRLKICWCLEILKNDHTIFCCESKT